MNRETKLTQKKVVFVVAHRNFRDEEYAVPHKILSDAGIQVITASSTLLESTGRFGTKVKPDMCLSEVEASNFDAVVFIGGSGSEEYWDNPIAHRVARDTIKAGKLLCAICIAPVIFVKAGVLKGIKATVFPSEIDILRKNGTIYTGNHVEIDKSIITADGPESASQFGETIKNYISK